MRYYDRDADQRIGFRIHKAVIGACAWIYYNAIATLGSIVIFACDLVGHDLTESKDE